MIRTDEQARSSAPGVEQVSEQVRHGVTVSVWLDHAAVVTADLTRSIDFYTGIMGLRVHIEEEDPLRRGRRRAMLFDSNGRDVMELIEMPEFRHRTVAGRGSVHHLGFRFPESDWKALVERLDAGSHSYQIEWDILFLRDADGLLLEVTCF
jgi:glyoxylase I family protein